MLVTFDSKSGLITMFGDAAKALLKLMGQSGDVPGAILGKDIPPALERLRKGVGKIPATSGQADTEGELPDVTLRQRAVPLIDLLERAARNGHDVIWRKGG